MNIFLVPYTWMRHFHLALICGGAALLAWWVVLFATMHLTWWGEAGDGPVLLGAIAMATAASSVLAETSLRRDALWRRVAFPALAALIALLISELWWFAWNNFTGPLIFSGTDAQDDLTDASLVSLRYRLLPFATTGAATAVGTAIARKLQGFFTQIFAGVASGLVSAGVWHGTSYALHSASSGDLYVSAALAAFAFGATFGLFAWGIPDSLYAGWVRVVSETRHGRRIPVDGADGQPRERFVGHFPRGLDLFLPHEDGVQELHISVLVNQKQEYRVRGLSLAPTRVSRFLESFDLHYDQRRPAPLDTRLESGDRIVIGKGKTRTVLEFLMLPREER